MKRGAVLRGFTALIALWLFLPLFQSHGSYADSFSPVSSEEGKTAPSYQVPGNPHPTSRELIETLESVKASQAMADLSGQLEEIYYQLGLAYAQQHEIDKAVLNLQAAVKLNPLHFQAWCDLGANLHDSGRMEEALQAYQNATKSGLADGTTWNRLALLLLELHRFDESGTALAQGFEIDPDSTFLWNTLGMLRIDQESFAAAAAAFRRATEINPGYATGWCNLGLAQIRLNDLDEGIADCQKALEIDPKLIGAWNDLVAAYDKKGQPDARDDAIHHSLALNPDQALVWAALGHSLFTQGKWDDAVDAFSNAVDRLGIKNAAAVAEYGEAAANLGHFDDAGKLLGEATGLDPFQAWIWQKLAAISNDDQEIEKAAGRAISLDPHDLLSLRMLARVEQRLGKGPESEAACRSILALQDIDAADWDGLGVALLLEKKYADAVTAFNKAIDLGGNQPLPAQAKFWAGLASAHMYNVHLAGPAEWQASADAWNKSVALDPTVPGSWFYLDVCEIGLGNKDQAQAARAKLDALVGDPKVDLSALPILPPSVPVDAQNALAQASLLSQQKQVKEALSILWQALNAQPDDAKLQEATIEALLHDHRYAQALRIALRATQARPNEAGSWLFLGQVYCESRRYDEAETALAKASRINPQLAPIWFIEGTCFLEQKKYDAAIGSFTKTIDLTPEMAAAWADLETGYAPAHDLAACQAKMEDLLRTHPEAGAGWDALVRVQRQRGLADEARVSMQKAIALKSPDAKRWCCSLGVGYARLNQIDQAIDAFHQALQFDPAYVEAWNDLGYALFSQGKPDEAIDAYKKALQSNPRHARALFNLTTAYQQQGQWGLAKETCDQLAQVEPAQAAQLAQKFPAATPAPEAVPSLPGDVSNH